MTQTHWLGANSIYRSIALSSDGVVLAWISVMGQLIVCEQKEVMHRTYEEIKRTSLFLILIVPLLYFKCFFLISLIIFFFFNLLSRRKFEYIYFKHNFFFFKALKRNKMDVKAFGTKEK